MIRYWLRLGTLFLQWEFDLDLFLHQSFDLCDLQILFLIFGLIFLVLSYRLLDEDRGSEKNTAKKKKQFLSWYGSPVFLLRVSEYILDFGPATLSEQVP